MRYGIVQVLKTGVKTVIMERWGVPQLFSSADRAEQERIRLDYSNTYIAPEMVVKRICKARFMSVAAPGADYNKLMAILDKIHAQERKGKKTGPLQLQKTI